MNPTIVLQHLVAFLLGSLVLVHALLLGYPLLDCLGRRRGTGKSHPPSLTLSVAFGLGVLSLVLWSLGALGALLGWNFFRAWIAWLALALTCLLLLPLNRKLIQVLSRRLRDSAEAIFTMPLWISPVIFIIGAFILFRLFIFAVSPSYQYDILEYHEPIVRQILAEGTLAPVDGIAYSKMPWGAHLLYAWGGLFIGDLAPSPLKIMNIWLGLVAALTVSAGMARWRIAAPYRLLAMGIFLMHPLTEILLADAYVGVAQTLYVTTAAVFLIRAMRVPNRIDPILAAITLGFALGCKYTVAGVAIIPLLAVFAFVLPKPSLPRWLGQRNVFIRWIGAMVFGGMIVGLSYGPWALRGLVIGDSFFPPITDRWIGKAPSTEHLALESFMRDSHAVDFPPDASFLHRFRGNIDDAGWILFLTILLAAALPSIDRRTRALAFTFILGYAVWNLAPRGESRFLAPLLGVLVIVGVAVARDATRKWFGTIGCLVLIPVGVWSMNYFLHQTRFVLMPVNSPQPQGALMRHAALDDFPLSIFYGGLMGRVNADLFSAVRSATADEDRVLMIYEARAAIVPEPAKNRINTVFDPSPLWQILRSDDGREPARVLERLREEGYTLLVVNEVELGRLLMTYPATPARDDAGFSPLLDRVAAKERPYLDLLSFKQYYPPYYYFSHSPQEREAILQRLEQFMRYLWDQPGTYSEKLGPARLMVRRIGDTGP
ncbi:MAG: hypothetical protein ACOC2L_04335 [Candidatus Sumerlaeota bacterium]